MIYYLEALFSAKYFPFWETTCFFFLIYNISISIRLNRIENNMNKYATNLKELIEELLDEYSR